MIYKELTAEDLQSEFLNYDRDNFSIDGYEAMISLYEDNDVQLDVIALDCDFIEADEEQIRSDYTIDINTSVLNYLEDHTTVVELSNGNFLFQKF